MPLYVHTNQASIEVQRRLDSLQGGLVQSMQRLSSGLRVNSASDDAASLSISEGLKAQVSGLLVAERNANSAIGFAQTGEAAVAQQVVLAGRLRDLALESANGDLTATDRTYLNTEFASLLQEMNRVASVTAWNGTSLLSGLRATMDFQVGVGTATSDRISVRYGGASTAATAYNIFSLSVDTTSEAQTAIRSLDNAISTISSRRQEFGTSVNRLQAVVASLQAQRTNLSAANSQILDVDVADETSRLTRTQVLLQAGTAVLGQANQSGSLALRLLQ